MVGRSMSRVSSATVTKILRHRCRMTTSALWCHVQRNATCHASFCRNAAWTGKRSAGSQQLQCSSLQRCLSHRKWRCRVSIDRQCGHMFEPSLPGERGSDIEIILDQSQVQRFFSVQLSIAQIPWRRCPTTSSVWRFCDQSCLFTSVARRVFFVH